MTIPNSNGFVQRMPAFIGWITAIIVAVVFIVRTDGKAELALARVNDQELRIRAVEQCVFRMESDLKYVRWVVEGKPSERKTGE